MSSTAVAAPSMAKADASKLKKAASSSGKKNRAYPTYHEIIKEAIVSLKDRTGSSHIAIAKFIVEKQKKNLPSNFKKLLLVQLKKLVANGKLVKVKNSHLSLQLLKLLLLRKWLHRSPRLSLSRSRSRRVHRRRAGLWLR